MSRPSTNDPLEKFRFLISWDGITRAGFHDCQIPKRTTTAIPYREGTFADATQFSAGLNTFEDIVLSRGLVAKTADSNGDFYTWIKQVHNPENHPGEVNSSGTNSDNYRKTIHIQMLDRDGTVAREWEVYQAFPVHYVPGSDLNAAEDGDKSMEAVTLKYEDFIER